MKTKNYRAIKKAYTKVTESGHYKSTKKLISAIYVEMFLSGCSRIDEGEIREFVHATVPAV